MKKGILMSVMFVFCLSGCVSKISKISVYPDDDPRVKVYLEAAEAPYADTDYLMLELNVYNHSCDDLEMEIQCWWLNASSGEIVANNELDVFVKSGTKKRVSASVYYINGGTRHLYVECQINNMAIIVPNED